MKRYLILGAAVAAIGLLAVVISGAATSAQQGDGPVGSFLGKVAEKLGVSQDELETAIEEARIESIDEAVADGRITEEQAERLKERAEDGVPLLGPGFGRFVCHRAAAGVLGAAATVLDMPREDLLQQLQDGSSLGEVAEAQGMSVDDFKAALLEQVNTQLDEKVADEDLTQEQADNLYSRLEENIDDIVSGTAGDGPCHGPHRGRMGRGPLGEGLFEGGTPFDAPAEEPEAEESDVTA